MLRNRSIFSGSGTSYQFFVPVPVPSRYTIKYSKIIQRNKPSPRVELELCGHVGSQEQYCTIEQLLSQSVSAVNLYDLLQFFAPE